MWILKSRRSRARAIYLMTFLLGSALVAGTAMLGTGLSKWSADSDSENIAARAMLEVLDGVDADLDAQPAGEPLTGSAGETVAGLGSAPSSDGVYDAPLPTKGSTPDTTTESSDETEEYAGTPNGRLPSDDSTPNRGGPGPISPGRPKPNQPYAPSAPIVGLPAPLTPGGDGNPSEGPSALPGSPPILITGTPPSAPRPYNPPVTQPGAGPSAPTRTPQSPPAAPATPPVIVATLPPTPDAPPAGNPANVPDTPEASAPGAGDAGPTVAANPPPGDNAAPPEDVWISPGASPGVLDLLDFRLDGRTLLIEFASSEPGIGFDVLRVEGTALLDYGNIVFAFIGGYQPDEDEMYEFLQAQEIVWGDPGDVSLFYGVVDKGTTPDDLHAPELWEFYTQITDSSLFDVLQDDTAGRSSLFDGVAHQYDSSLALDVVAWQRRSQVAADTREDPQQTPIQNLISPNAVPSPGVLMLLLSGGISLVRVVSKTRRGR